MAYLTSLLNHWHWWSFATDFIFRGNWPSTIYPVVHSTWHELSSISNVPPHLLIHLVRRKSRNESLHIRFTKDIHIDRRTILEFIVIRIRYRHHKILCCEMYFYRFFCIGMITKTNTITATTTILLITFAPAAAADDADAAFFILMINRLMSQFVINNFMRIIHFFI